MNKTYLTIYAALSLLSASYGTSAAVITISAQSSPFEGFVPAVANAVCGDTIKWVTVNGSHTTASTTIPNGANAWNSPTITAAGYTYVVTVAGTYNYTCHPLSGGHMDASIVVTCTAGIPSINPDYISVAYPNPFRDRITIEQSANADRIVFYDMLGNNLKSVSLSPGQTKVVVEAAGLRKGIYFYSIIKESAIIETRKIVLQ